MCQNGLFADSSITTVVNMWHRVLGSTCLKLKLRHIGKTLQTLAHSEGATASNHMPIREATSPFASAMAISKPDASGAHSKALASTVDVVAAAPVVVASFGQAPDSW